MEQTKLKRRTIAGKYPLPYFGECLGPDEDLMQAVDVKENALGQFGAIRIVWKMLQEHDKENAVASLYMIGMSRHGYPIHVKLSNLYLTCQCWSLLIQQQKKIWCHKYWKMRIQSSWVENIVGKEKNCSLQAISCFVTMFQKLSVGDVFKWVSME